MGCGTSSPCRYPASNKTERAMKSAVLIQRWYRRHVARLEARRQCTWKIFQSIEYAAEQDQLKLHNFFSSLIEQHTPREPGECGAGGEDEVPRWLGRPPGGSCEEESALCDAIQVPGDYTGPRLDFPLAPGQAVALVNAFKKKQVLHARFALRLLLEARSLLHHLPTVRHASTANRRDITVCGDLHGQLEDLFLIFYKNGLPGVDRPYIFNGDFVDRGSSSLEVLLVLLAFLLAHPHDVFLNRGNHEDYVMNTRYGFTKEILMKYKVHGRLMARVVRDLFSWLPLATVVDRKVLVVHGGLSAATDLELLARIDRHRYVSALRPPKRRTNRGLDAPPADSSPSSSPRQQRSAHSSVSDDVNFDEEWKQVVDVLWSDPVPQEGCTPNLYRGGGCYFGPDVTRHMLHRHGLQLLVRSHECKQEGYERTHGGQVITIFSASNYYEVGSNRGAYMRLGPELTPSFVQYQVGKATRKLTLRQRVSAVEQSAIAALQEKLLAHRSQLMAAFERADPEHTGLVPVSEWALLVEQELQLGLPWRLLHQQLTGATGGGGGAAEAPGGSVAYAGCFPERHAGQTQLHSGMQPGLLETIYRHRSSLESIFHAIDQDHSGLISFEEFRQAWRLLSSHVQEGVSDDDVLGLARSIDFNQDGSIDFNEFLEAFRLADKPQ
ncbi:serine/threonine-protein phosphatase with EF-hands 2-like [Petromyzon marinus]|uniref:serine/threonine-protein phosphatase with EF-hands 2-like n=1 Tax=Petromyzon marinus TaxID=7757 RepID=UPI003F71BCC3